MMVIDDFILTPVDGADKQLIVMRTVSLVYYSYWFVDTVAICRYAVCGFVL